MTLTPNRTCSAFPLNVKIDKADVGLENVDNTSDLDKPISNAVRDYMDKTISDAETALAAANTALETAGTLNEQSRTSMESAKTSASDAASSALASETALSKAEVYAANAGTSADDASRYASNAKGSAESASATLANAVTKDGTQTVTGAKTFAGDTTVTGSFVTSGTAEMAKLDIDTGTLTVGSGGTVEINGALTASNTANTFQAANHDKVLVTNDVLTAKDINEVNGIANNVVHRNGDEPVAGDKTFISPITGTARLPLFTNNSAISSYLVFTYPLTMMAASVRGSMLVWISGRTREAGALVRIRNEQNKNFSLVTIVCNGSVSMSNVALSHDDTNMYLTIVGSKAASSDGMYATIIGVNEMIFTDYIQPTGVAADAIPGTLDSTFKWLYDVAAIEVFRGWVQFYNMPCLHEKTFSNSESTGGQWVKCFSYPHEMNYQDGLIDVEVFTGHSTEGRGKTTLELLRRNYIPVCRVKDCCNSSFVVGRLPTDSTEDGACVINDGTNDTLYIYTGANRPAYRVTFATCINPWGPASDNSEYNPGCCTRYAFDNYVTIYDEIVEALPTEYVSIGYPKVVTPKS